MPIESRNKGLYLKIGQKTVIFVQVCVCPDGHKSKKSEKYKWFGQQHFLLLLARLEDISLARVLSCETVELPTNVKEVIKGPDSSFHILYSFKKSETKQYILTQSSKVKLRHQESVEKFRYSGGRHSEFHLFSDKLVVLISLESIVLGQAAPAPQVTREMMKKRKEKSKYFKKVDDSKLTNSAVKKQANLRSIVNKMKSTTENDQPTPVEQHPKSGSILILNNSSQITTQNGSESTNVFSEKPCNQDHIFSLGNQSGSSRKRMRNETEGSEETGSESQYSEKDDFVSSKKPALRRKRQKYLHKESSKDNKENCQLMNDYLVNADSEASCSSVDDKLKISSNVTEEIECVVSTTHSEMSCEKTSEIAGAEEVTTEKDNSSPDVSPVAVGIDVEERKDKEHETITIKDVIPCFENIREVSDLTNDHIEYLVQKLQKKLKNIFKGKEYCRRHEDYKKGGRSKGDLAFQVRFGLYSEDQHDIIMQELMSIFCARHNKYIDYLSKVLLPETFVLIYMEVFGGNHDDVERKLMGNDKKEIDSTVTDGSSTE